MCSSDLADAGRLAPVLPTGIGLAGPLAAAGERPRLWIDLVLFIEMALDPKTYRLSLEGSDGRVVLFETQDPAEMAERVLREVAQLAVARERQLATVRPDSRPTCRRSSSLPFFPGLFPDQYWRAPFSAADR